MSNGAAQTSSMRYYKRRLTSASSARPSAASRQQTLLCVRASMTSTSLPPFDHENICQGSLQFTLAGRCQAGSVDQSNRRWKDLPRTSARLARLRHRKSVLYMDFTTWLETWCRSASSKVLPAELVASPEMLPGRACDTMVLSGDQRGSARKRGAVTPLGFEIALSEAVFTVADCVPCQRQSNFPHFRQSNFPQVIGVWCRTSRG